MPPVIFSRMPLARVSDLWCKEFFMSFFFALVALLAIRFMPSSSPSPAHQIVIPNASRENMYEEFRSQSTKDCLGHWTRAYQQIDCYHGIYNIWDRILSGILASSPCDRHHRRKLTECPSKWAPVVTDVMGRDREDYDRLIRLWYTTRGYTSGRLGSICEGDWGFTPCIRDIMEREHKKQPGEDTEGRGPEECLEKLKEIGRRSKACGDFVQTSMAQSSSGRRGRKAKLH